MIGTGHLPKRVGFTIVELLIVIVVIAILAAITIVGYTGISKNAVVSTVQSSLQSIAQKVTTEHIKSATGEYPTAFPEGISATEGVGFAFTYVSSSTSEFCVNGTAADYDDITYHINQSLVISEGLCEGEVIPASVIGDYNTEAGGEGGGGAIAVVTDGLIGWWPFNGSPNDASSNGYTGTLHGGVATATGQNGEANGAYDLDGVDDYIDLGDALNDLAFPFTISVWIYLDESPSSTEMPILTTEHAPDNYLGTRFFTRSAQPIYHLLGDGGNPGANSRRSVYTSGTALSTGSWYHIVTVVDSLSSMTAYQDNVELSPISTSGSGSSMQTSTSYNATVGVVYNNTYVSGNTTLWYSDFKIDDLRVYGRALTAQEVADLYNAGAY